MNLTDFPQLAVECGSVGLIPVFLEMTDTLKDSISDMIPFEVIRSPFLGCVKWSGKGEGGCNPGSIGVKGFQNTVPLIC